MLFATAGHIDHGKSSLVRALTGVDTDRLPEEKARGISIELGFAHWPQDDGRVIGFVDVPGHERLVRTMLAGVGGVEAALLVVALDDGVMPQTREHLRILDLLGIHRGVVALTKADKATPTRIAQVRAQVAELLASTALAGAPTFAVSAQTGAGIAELAAALRAEAAPARPEPSGAFRLAVDRAFTVPGTGTVVTGTIRAGSVAVGDRLVVAPTGSPVRVRGLQRAGRGVASARSGERCALALAGIELGQVHRGDWLVPSEMARPTTRIEARITVLPGRVAPLKHGSTVHLHMGTAALAARVLTRRQAAIPSGASACAVLALATPTLAVNGERFVLRDGADRELLGGGRVLDPFAPLRRRPGEPRDAILAALEHHDADDALVALLAIPGYEIDAAGFATSYNLPDSDLAALVAATQARAIGTPARLLARARLAALAEEIAAALATCHRDHPERGGLTRRELRAALALPPSPEVLAALLREAADAGKLETAGPLLRLPGHSARFSQAETALWQALLARIEDGPPRTFTAAELSRELHTTEPTVRTLLYRRRANGDLWAIDETRFMLREHVSALAASAAAIAAEGPAALTAARFRDATGIGRNHVIRILEFLDRIGVTARRGEARTVRSDYRTIAGEAPAWLIS